MDSLFSDYYNVNNALTAFDVDDQLSFIPQRQTYTAAHYSEALERYIKSEGESLPSSGCSSPVLTRSTPGGHNHGPYPSSPRSPAYTYYQDGHLTATRSPLSSHSGSVGYDGSSPRLDSEDFQGDLTLGGRDFPVCCLYAGCDAKPFKRRADLDRHYKHKHAPASQKESYFCDYPRCARRHDAFHRRDHFRDHLREFHKEVIEKRGGSSNIKDGDDDEEWLNSSSRHRKSSSSSSSSSPWWRCSKCLVRVYVHKSGYDCPDCKSSSPPKRKRTRSRQQ